MPQRPTPAPPAEPVYQRIVREFTSRIDSGELKPGDRLPSTSQLAQQYQCAPATVRHALSRLHALGLIQGHQGRGVFVRAAPD
ncbi:winged helix-turn-helix domain-containing protein [Micromonospora sp. WMMD1082]|uniref:winged helix-turn-helix domain-containing protein n=1 Tax=Micromonospora sp. WMMD1082 TaxID=3016104 RepID=UPI002416B2D4|nr:winged helix-turn-helix domain-containing protein [Micromonospora sp. WMMD1082]MDG4795127.1 winged helix-turn-helix domain-containing protein [Micromonospora sp. WMMD1082]